MIWRRRVELPIDTELPLSATEPLPMAIPPSTTDLALEPNTNEFGALANTVELLPITNEPSAPASIRLSLPKA